MHKKTDKYICEHYSRIKPMYQSVSISHSIPLASIAAINNTQGEIIAFNNTLYSLIYQDTTYTTQHIKNEDEIVFLEGEKNGTSIQPYMLPTYVEKGGEKTNGIQFSPFYHPENMKILYPGNNGCELTWSVQDEHKHIYKNLSNGPYNWRLKTKTCNYIKPKEEITICQALESSATLPVQLRHGSNKKVAYMNPIPNILIKVLPICAPSTCKRLPHYCKSLITIKMGWEVIKHQITMPLYMTPFCDFSSKEDHVSIRIPGSTNISEEHENEVDIPLTWKTPGNSDLAGEFLYEIDTEANIEYYENKKQKFKKVKTLKNVQNLQILQNQKVQVLKK